MLMGETGHEIAGGQKTPAVSAEIRVPEGRGGPGMSDTTGTPSDGMPYENTADPVWARQALDLYRRRQLQVAAFDSEGVVSAQVWGPCPRCGHEMDVQSTLTTPVSELRRGWWSVLTGQATHDGGGIPQTVEVGCGCGRVHPGAPEKVLGCGVSFNLPTTPPADGPSTTLAGGPDAPVDPQGSR